MKYSLIIFLVFLSITTYGAEKSLGAHEHGAVKLGIAIEGQSADIEIDGPTESFIDFEYLPKTEKEKMIFNNLKESWEKKLFTLVHFDERLKCKIGEAKLLQVIDQKETAEEQAKIKDPKKKEAGVHSDIEAHAKILCLSPIAGTMAQINLKKQFKNIKNLNVEILGNETKSLEIKSLEEKIKL